jgi:hypothetical protein
MLNSQCYVFFILSLNLKWLKCTEITWNIEKNNVQEKQQTQLKNNSIHLIPEKNKDSQKLSTKLTPNKQYKIKKRFTGSGRIYKSMPTLNKNGILKRRQGFCQGIQYDSPQKCKGTQMHN